MPSKNLSVGSWNIKLTVLKKEPENYETVDVNGNPLIYVPGKVERGYWKNDKDEKVTEIRKMINEKPMAKLEATKETDYKEVDINETLDINETYIYHVECPELLKYLKDNSNKAIKILYSNGNGYKAYYGYFYYSKIHDRVLLKLGDLKLSSAIQKIEDRIINKKRLKEVTVQEKERVKTADLLEL